MWGVMMMVIIVVLVFVLVLGIGCMLLCAIYHQKTFPTVRICHIAIITLNVMLT